MTCRTRPGLDTSTPAVIFKLGHNVMHHGGLGAIRSLGVPVDGVHEHPLAPAANSGCLHDRWIWRPPAEDAERVRAGLLTLLESAAEAQEFADRIGFPLVAKLAAPGLVSGREGPRSTTVIRTREEPAHAYRACADPHGAALMLQEHIPHQPGQDLFFHGYINASFGAALSHFDDPQVVAVAGAVRTRHEHGLSLIDKVLVCHRQRIYAITQRLLKCGQTWRSANTTHIVPGFASIYRTTVLPPIEMNPPGLMTEDVNMTFEIYQKQLGKQVTVSPAAVAPAAVAE